MEAPPMREKQHIAAARGPSLRRALGAVTATAVLAALIGPLSRLGVSFSDALARYPWVSYTVAYLLLAVALAGCAPVLLRPLRRLEGRNALKCYILFSFGMSAVYFLVQQAGLECFSFPEPQPTAPSILDFIYFSFVTVTTVGYGDIIPRHSFARGLVLLQVLFGLSLILRSTGSQRSKG